VEFSPELRDEVISGAITVSFRLWRRPKVRLGGRYPVGPAYIEVDGVELVPFSSVTAEDVQRSGEADRETLRRRAAHAGPIHDDTLVYRVDFHLVGEASSSATRPRPASRPRPATGSTHPTGSTDPTGSTHPDQPDQPDQLDS
jgi:hypothetical protein